jgi:hypothetical protein
LVTKPLVSDKQGDSSPSALELLPTNAQSADEMIFKSPELGCLDGIDKACAGSSDGKEVYRCIDTEYSISKFNAYKDEIDYNFSADAAVSVDQRGDLITLLVNGTLTKDAETFVHVTVTCMNYVAVSFTEYAGLQPKISGKVSDTEVNIERRESESAGLYGQIIAEKTQAGVNMAFLQFLDGEVLYVSQFNQDGVATLADFSVIGGHDLPSESINPPFFLQEPSKTTHQSSSTGEIELQEDRIAVNATEVISHNASEFEQTAANSTFDPKNSTETVREPPRNFGIKNESIIPTFSIGEHPTPTNAFNASDEKIISSEDDGTGTIFLVGVGSAVLALSGIGTALFFNKKDPLVALSIPDISAAVLINPDMPAVIIANPMYERRGAIDSSRPLVPLAPWHDEMDYEEGPSRFWTI